MQLELDEAEKIVKAYRRSSPEVVKLWKRVEGAVRHAFTKPKTRIKITDGLSVIAGKTSFHIILPSGRRLRYNRVKVGKEIIAFGRNNVGQYGLVKLYGGKLVGHIIQSLARELMAFTLLRLDAAGFALILTVHDEAVALAQRKSFALFQRLMLELPDWAVGLPVGVDCFKTPRYRK